MTDQIHSRKKRNSGSAVVSEEDKLSWNNILHTDFARSIIEQYSLRTTTVSVHVEPCFRLLPISSVTPFHREHLDGSTFTGFLGTCTLTMKIVFKLNERLITWLQTREYMCDHTWEPVRQVRAENESALNVETYVETYFPCDSDTLNRNPELHENYVVVVRYREKNSENTFSEVALLSRMERFLQTATTCFPYDAIDICKKIFPPASAVPFNRFLANQRKKEGTSTATPVDLTVSSSFTTRQREDETNEESIPKYLNKLCHNSVLLQTATWCSPIEVEKVQTQLHGNLVRWPVQVGDKWLDSQTSGSNGHAVMIIQSVNAGRTGQHLRLHIVPYDTNVMSLVEEQEEFSMTEFFERFYHLPVAHPSIPFKMARNKRMWLTKDGFYDINV